MLRGEDKGGGGVRVEGRGQGDVLRGEDRRRKGTC